MYKSLLNRSKVTSDAWNELMNKLTNLLGTFARFEKAYKSWDCVFNSIAVVVSDAVDRLHIPTPLRLMVTELVPWNQIYLKFEHVGELHFCLLVHPEVPSFHVIVSVDAVAKTCPDDGSPKIVVQPAI